MSIRFRTLTVSRDEGDVRLDRWIKRQVPGVGQGAIEKALRKGDIRVGGDKVKSNFRLQSGMQVQLPHFDLSKVDAPRAPKTVSDKDRDFMQSLILYQDRDMLVLNKPSGLATQGGTGTKRHVDGLLPALANKEGVVPKLVHRLDRDTSGVLMLGRNPASTASLAKAFKSRKAKKTYLALILGVPRPEEGAVKGFMKKGVGVKGREEMVWGKHGEKEAQYSLSLYRVLEFAGQKLSLVALRPETGRTHQLRFHMASIGHSILGDGKYTCDREAPVGLPDRLMLHAWELHMPHPLMGSLSFRAPLPNHFTQALSTLGLDVPTEDPFADLETE